MKVSKLAPLVAGSLLSVGANATVLTFDDAATYISHDRKGETLSFPGSVTATAGYSVNKNLAGSSFKISKNVQTNGVKVYQDYKPGNGGLGVVSAVNGQDNLNSNIFGGANQDEVIFFDFGQQVSLGTVWFNGEHTNLTQYGSSKSDKAMYNIFGSLDGNSYTSLIGGQKVPTARDYIELDNNQYQFFAVAATGWGPHKGYVEALDYTAVPEPSTLALLGLGLIGLGVARKRTA